MLFLLLSITFDFGSLLKHLLRLLFRSWVYFVLYLLVSYTSPPVRKLHSRSEIISKTYKSTFLATCFMAVLQPSGYSVFYGGDTPIWLGLPWWSYPCQCLNTKTSAWGNRGFTTETPSISYTFRLYIRLVVTL